METITNPRILAGWLPSPAPRWTGLFFDAVVFIASARCCTFRRPLYGGDSASLMLPPGDSASPAQKDSIQSLIGSTSAPTQFWTATY